MKPANEVIVTTPGKLIRRKLTLIKLAEILKNVSQACKISGVLNYRFIENQGIGNPMRLNLNLTVFFFLKRSFIHCSLMVDKVWYSYLKRGLIYFSAKRFVASAMSAEKPERRGRL